ncbi:response regulator [Cupriavidus consociatus]|uniref:response regulator n=1 Tax=Cupriavidus consociatus TaxID=2821357 RepID=UPI001AE592E6|nr:MULTISPECIES: response regulator transcription factor [unclassified Cupriavidus]MBP0620636.1 response regulator transcription factor [Cupriavidus sp. LEh25]MDK2657296.1 response regulator transcription factor [Cupriavidus sp. LEh21]
MIRILLADDHTIIRDGLKKILSTVPDMQVVAEAADGNELLALLRAGLPDVLLLDMSMPGRSGIVLIQQLQASYPALPVLVLSMYRESQYAVQAIRAGAAGYLTKNVESDQLIGAIRKVARGGTAVSPAIADKLIGQARQLAVLPHARLTARELQVFQMLAEGQGINEIALTLSLSGKTVSTHKANILAKLELSSTAGLVHYAIRHGLLAEAGEVGAASHIP